MGFRSTLISQEPYAKWPQWFREKYHQLIAVDDEALSRTVQIKAPLLPDLPGDVQRALTEIGYFDIDPELSSFVYVWLHECGGITRVQVNHDRITVTYPIGWAVREDGYQDSMHSDFCDGECSDAREAP